MVKQEIYKINDFSTPGGRRKLFIGTSLGTHAHTGVRPKWRKKKTVKLCNSTPTCGSLQDAIKEPFQHAFLNPSLKFL